jgi:hypothetical protein
MSNPNPQGGLKQQWWLSKQGKPVGPYDATFIMDGLRAGKISPDTFACLVGGSTWKKLNESKTFAAACPATSSAPATAPPPSSHSQPAAGASPQWWLSINGASAGPYSEHHVLGELKAGTIQPGTYACLAGTQEWKRLSEWPSFATECRNVAVQPLSPPPLPTVAGSAAGPFPWNPRVLGLLGLLFSPLWVGIMAAINARRLRTGLPAWRPVAIGVGATLLDAAIPGETLVLDLVLYLGALGLIWGLDLAPQIQFFEKQQAATRRRAAWLVPCLAGGPCALVVLRALVVAPLLPLEPREVCQRFVDAKSLNDAKQYSTPNLWLTLEILNAHPDEPGSTSGGALTEEGEAPPEFGGYCVGYRMYGKSKSGEQYLLEGFFYLKESDGAWKINDWLITSFNGQEVSGSITELAGQLASGEPTKIVAEPQHASHGMSHVMTQGLMRAGARGVAHLFEHDGRGLAAIGAAIVAALAAIGRFFGMKTGGHPRQAKTTTSTSAP